ncbi:alpha/beta fold hydrolase [Microbacterium jiangjiandongii]|uniref:alpha/beta fold hydrolase n=1 Tax=Microbacterium jiangjiandongii TaxID=3049071 RepID=UPI00214C4EFE|nr:alpha/beta fold hydrolase [Microbacterium sp. zg.Y843]MCR2816466.1 alpha/beta fold hydrolase [Microbacterium sp. zg.Y843]
MTVDVVTVDVVFVHGAGRGAYDADARMAASLARHLGHGFPVHLPRLPEEEDDADDSGWFAAIDDALTHARQPVVLVGHSAGGYVLLRYLARTAVSAPIAALCLIAVPFPGGDAAWTFDGFELPHDLDRRLPAAAAVWLYASPDDEVVPFAHRDLYAAAIPRAVTRTVTGGHQLGDDLRVVADDIRGVVGDGIRR